MGALNLVALTGSSRALHCGHPLDCLGSGLNFLSLEPKKLPKYFLAVFILNKILIILNFFVK
jgi:hypothetical protein